MFKVYKRTIHIGSTSHPQQIEYQFEENGRSKISKFVTIPAMIAGALFGTLVFSVFFALLLIPLGIIGFRAWRLIRTARQQSVNQAEGESIAAEYTVISDKDKK
jgi:predicted lipid-binding transport protein (Tim44 family)